MELFASQGYLKMPLTVKHLLDPKWVRFFHFFLLNFSRLMWLKAGRKTKTKQNDEKKIYQ